MPDSFASHNGLSTQTKDDSGVAVLTPIAIAAAAHMTHLVDQLQKLEERVRAGGGADKVEKQHKVGKPTARERSPAISSNSSST